MAFQISLPFVVSPVMLNMGSQAIAAHTPPPATKAWISDWMELLLSKVADGRLGPTVTTRWMFLAANMIYNSYQFVTPSKTPVDMSYWQSFDKGQIITNDLTLLQSWIEVACQYFFPILIRDWMGIPLSDEEVNAIQSGHTPLSPVNQASMSQLRTLLDEYIINRDDDGWRDTFTFSGTLPNGSNTISADNSENQNLNLLPEPKKWTPLMLAGKTKRYLTPEWGTANKGILTDSKFAELLAAADELFPSDTQYIREMQQVAAITASLTSEQKMVAEYWAGGPGTVTPPGMWMVLMDVVIRSNGLTLLQEIKNYTILAAGLYQAGICAWRLKRDHLQARPIQIVREMEYMSSISQAWNNKTLGQYWLPYQTLDFVTPPFPDFVSGHSTFSMASAKLFCCLLQSDQVVLNNPMITLPIINKFSPILQDNTLNFSINSVFLLPKCSEVQPGVEPTTGVSLGWSTWTGMAQSSGASRIYGGIHIESSNQAGQYLGRLIGDQVWDKLKGI